MLKKLSSLLFEEEEEILEETILEEEPKPKKGLSFFEPKAKKEIIDDKPLVKKPSVIAQMNPDLVRDEPKEEEPLTEEKIRSNFGISADEPEDIDDFVKVQDTPKPNPVSMKQESHRKVYEFHPVISPIFGVKESAQKDNSPRVLYEEAPTLPKSVINTVISPIYGDMDNSKASTKEKLKEEPFLSKPELLIKTPIVEETKSVDTFVLEHVEPTLTEEFVEESVDLESFGLEDLIKSSTPKMDSLFKTPEKEESDDDAHQFSLFDDVK